MSAPLRMSAYELQVAVGALLLGPGFRNVVQAMVVYARRSEAAHNAIGDLDGADKWVFRAAMLEQLLEEE